MRRLPLTFEYHGAPIGSIAALSRHLGLSEAHLRSVLKRVGPRAYRRLKRKDDKVDTGGRLPPKVTYSPEPWLRDVQDLIKDRLLRRVRFPPYVVGGVPGRDLRTAVARHVHARSLLSFDVARCFESTSMEQVRRIFARFFRFPPEVSQALVALTTVHGHVPRGALTSSYLANLVFHDDEPELVAWLEGLVPFQFRYSRWVDDTTITSRQPLTDEAITEVTGRVFKMLTSHGLPFQTERRVPRVDRSKRRVEPDAPFVKIHNIQVRGARMSVSGEKRGNVRAQVHRLVRAVEAGPLNEDHERLYRSMQSTIGYMQHFHPREMAGLRKKLVEVGRRHRQSGQLASGGSGVVEECSFRSF